MKNSSTIETLYVKFIQFWYVCIAW